MAREVKVYDTFNDEPEKIPQLTAIDLAVRELTPEDRRQKYSSKYVKAIVSSDPTKLPEGDELLIRYQRGHLLDKKWAIKIVEEIGEYKEVVAEVIT